VWAAAQVPPEGWVPGPAQGRAQEQEQEQVRALVQWVEWVRVQWVAWVRVQAVCRLPQRALRQRRHHHKLPSKPC